MDHSVRGRLNRLGAGIDDRDDLVGAISVPDPPGRPRLVDGIASEVAETERPVDERAASIVASETAGPDHGAGPDSDLRCTLTVRLSTASAKHADQSRDREEDQRTPTKLQTQ